jgi:hypothetical protein
MRCARPVLAAFSVDIGIGEKLDVRVASPGEDCERGREEFHYGLEQAAIDEGYPSAHVSENMAGPRGVVEKFRRRCSLPPRISILSDEWMPRA